MEKHYNLIYLFNATEDKVLMQMRIKAPFLGLLNGSGGKIEKGESILHSCYRELNEETGYTPRQHTEFQMASVRYENGDHVYVHYARLTSDALPATMGEPLEFRWLDVNVLREMPKERLAPNVHRDLQHCMKFLSQTAHIKDPVLVS